ncbi:MAG: Rid family detoxifying hydrolase [Gemmatimonadota bacterium]|jgi:2-iminobutanoate/2-iminopropanoate deaminase
MTRKVVATDRIAEPVGPFSSAAWAGELLFVSGHVAQDPATGALLHSGDAATQTEQIFRNLEVVLDAAGRSFAHVVRVGVFLTDLGDFRAMNEVYARYFDAPYPARTTIQVAALPLGDQVEVEMVVH